MRCVCFSRHLRAPHVSWVCGGVDWVWSLHFWTKVFQKCSSNCAWIVCVCDVVGICEPTDILCPRCTPLRCPMTYMPDALCTAQHPLHRPTPSTSPNTLCSTQHPPPPDTQASARGGLFCGHLPGRFPLGLQHRLQHRGSRELCTPRLAATRHRCGAQIQVGTKYRWAPNTDVVHKYRWAPNTGGHKYRWCTNTGGHKYRWAQIQVGTKYRCGAQIQVGTNTGGHKYRWCTNTGGHQPTTVR